MFAAVLLAGLIAAPLASLALLTTGTRRLHAAGWFHLGRRLVYALVALLAVAAVTAAALLALQVSRPRATVAVAILIGFGLVWLPFTRRWTGRAHVAWSTGLFLFLAFLAYLLWWTFASHLGPLSTAGGVLLWLFEAFAALLASAYLWELCDVLGTEDWRRRITQDTRVATAATPFVSLHVPAHNEPADMVIATLTSLIALDYPAYQIVAIDDNSDDEATWRPVQQWCAEHGVTFAHLADWPGYKSGALNYALRELTDPRAEVIGVIDSDYQVSPGFLRRCAPLFADPGLGFIQAPQDYRDWSQASFYRRLYFSYQYFFAVTQPSRNERDGAIFAGTMGLIRRQAIEDLGGWDEWCITEDAELSLRLLRAGWSGLHVDESFGFGVMPLTFEALKSQRYRWCFGGIQIMRLHARDLLLRRRAGRLSPGQRWAYLCGGLQWYGDLLGVVFYAFLLAGAVNLAAGGGQLYRKLTLFLVAAIGVLVALGLLRAIALIRRGTGASWRDAIGAFFIWQSTGLVVARASVQALFARRAEFLRTPKTSDKAHAWQAFTANWAETVLGVLGVAGIVAALTRLDTLSGPLLALLLLVPALGYLAAPVNSLAARRAALPPDLRARRSTEWRRERRAVATGAAVVGTGAAFAAVVAIVGLLLAPSPRFVPPTLIGPDRPAHSNPTKSPAPSGSLPPGPGSAPTGAPSGPTAGEPGSTAASTPPPATTEPEPSGSPTVPPTTPATAPS